jgi:uncharacterized protein YqhQ
MVLGIKSLFYSAEVASFGDEEKIPPIAIAGVVILSLAFAVGLFFISPLLIARVLDAYITSDLLSNVIEGIIRITIFVLYLVAIRQFPDVKRIYRYHGAEHKVINAYEAGRELLIDEIKPYPTAHTRCGTSFIFVVMAITILVFAIVGRPSIFISIVSRIALLPVIAAIGYEITRLGARYCTNPLAKILLAPGLLLQSLTTMEPDDNQIKAAVSSLKEVIVADGHQVITESDQSVSSGSSAL